MKCPYCNGEMQAGYLRNPRGVIAWTPAEEKANVLQNRVKDYQIALGTHTALNGTTVQTAHCPDCEIFLIAK